MTSSDMGDIRIGVVLPSRGLIFSQTADDLLQNLTGFDYDIFFAHGLPIPLCFERPLRKALEGSYSHIWFVESDMILPESTLESMLLMDAPVVTMDYPTTKKGQGSTLISKEDEVVFCGTGCLLVKRAVFDKLQLPYFRTDIRWGAVNYGKFIRFTAKMITNKSLGGYGLHDVNFCMKLWQAGIPISLAGTIGQRKLLKLGEPGTNEGAHKIEEWNKVIPNFLYKKLKSTKPLPLGALISVQTVSGELLVHPDKAKKLIKAGVATAIPTRSISVDYNELQI